MSLRHLQLFAVALPAALVLDFAWIAIFAQQFYQQEIGYLLATDVNWTAALLFYVFYIIALIVFVLVPAFKANSMRKALVLGAFLGFTAYMTYDLTSLATTRDWTLAVTIVDIAWGTVMSAAVAVFTYWVGKKFLKF